jgi:hypothetical protein
VGENGAPGRAGPAAQSSASAVIHQQVLDPGSGGGIDVLLSARRVGPSGFAAAWT